MLAESTIIYKASLAIFKNKKMLLTREHGNDAFYLLGGTMGSEEDDEACLNREIREEVGVGIKPGSLRYLAEFEDEAHGRVNTRIHIRLYTGELDNEPQPATEDIAEITYWDSSIDSSNLTPISRQVFRWLKTHGYIT